MTESEQQAALNERLRAERENLPEDVRGRLATSRRQAVALLEESENSRWSLLDLLAPKGLAAAAAVSVAAIALWVGLSSTQEPALPLLSAPEVAVVQDLELLEELEFLAWLEEESQGAG
jgi:hypothetical protein